MYIYIYTYVLYILYMQEAKLAIPLVIPWRYPFVQKVAPDQTTNRFAVPFSFPLPFLCLYSFPFLSPSSSLPFLFLFHSFSLPLHFLSSSPLPFLFFSSSQSFSIPLPNPFTFLFLSFSFPLPNHFPFLFLSLFLSLSRCLFLFPFLFLSSSIPLPCVFLQNHG